jgi:hypothetical protein
MKRIISNACSRSALGPTYSRCGRVAVPPLPTPREKLSKPGSFHISKTAGDETLYAVDPVIPLYSRPQKPAASACPELYRVAIGLGTTSPHRSVTTLAIEDKPYIASDLSLRHCSQRSRMQPNQCHRAAREMQPSMTLCRHPVSDRVHVVICRSSGCNASCLTASHPGVSCLDNSYCHHYAVLPGQSCELPAKTQVYVISAHVAAIKSYHQAESFAYSTTTFWDYSPLAVYTPTYVV